MSMFWYIVICVLMLYPLSIIHAGNISGKKTKHLALIIACFILWFFMAMRNVTVGVDTKYYSYVFAQFSQIPLSKVFSAVTYATSSRTWSFDFEPGYRMINKLVSYISDSPQAITIFNSTLIITLLYNVIRRNSPNYLLSIWLYITLGIYQTEMNVTRNAIAILIVYNAFSFARTRQFGKYVLMCLLATSFHVAALVFIPIYWLIHYVRIDIKRGILFIGAACLIGAIFPIISPYIRILLPDRFDRYFEGNNDKLVSLMVGMMNAGVFVVTYLMMRESERKKVVSDYSIGVTMLVLNLCFFGLNIGLEYASRMAALFGPYLIIFIPQMLSLMESKSRRKTAAWIITVICGVQYVLRLCINNIGGTMPYRFMG